MESTFHPPTTASNPAKTARPVRIPIRIKFTFTYILLATVIALVGTYLVSRIVFENADERYTNQLIEAGKLSSEWMVGEENRLLESLRAIAHTQNVAQALQAADSGLLQEQTFNLALNTGEEAVLFLNSRGAPVLAMRHKPGGKMEDYLFSQGGETPSPQWPFVEAVLQGKTDALGDKYSGLAADGPGQTFFVSGPVYAKDGTLAGVALVGKTLPTLIDQMHAGTLAQITLYDVNGAPLASSLVEPRLIAASDAVEILVRKNEDSLKRDLGNMRSLTSSDIQYGEILTSWQARGGAELGLLGASLAKNVWVSMSIPTRTQALAVLALALAVTSLVGINFANQITRPLLNLVFASQQVSKGNLQVNVPPTSNDEIGYLAQTFNQMVGNLDKSQKALQETYDKTLLTLSKAVELRDRETGDHIERVADMTVRLAILMGIQGEALVHIRRGALLHDAGKIGIPDRILRKSSKLNDEEWAIMRQHPLYAVEMLQPIEYLRPALDIPAYHHEKWDGSGYPGGLKGEEIPLAARIFALIDVWDALRSDRVYRRALPEEKALAIMREGSGSHFDPQVAECFLEHLAEIQNAPPMIEAALGPEPALHPAE